MKDKIFVFYSTNRDDAAQEVFNKHIEESIGCEHVIMPFYNVGQSLTSVYNLLWKKTEDANLDNSIFVFCHHDIHFRTKEWGKILLNLYKNEVDIIGVAGTDKLNSHCVWWLGDKEERYPRSRWGKVLHADKERGEWLLNCSMNKKCAELQPVVAIDGLFIALNPVTCSKFDEEFEGFHFYDISFCIKNFVEGRKIAVTETIRILHDSYGSKDEEWEKNRSKLSQKYKYNFYLKV